MCHVPTFFNGIHGPYKHFFYKKKKFRIKETFSDYFDSKCRNLVVFLPSQGGVLTVVKFSDLAMPSHVAVLFFSFGCVLFGKWLWGFLGQGIRGERWGQGEGGFP